MLPIPTAGLSKLWAEHQKGPKSTLRAKLIEAIAKHEGWEESAIAMVDEAVMPALQRWSGYEETK